MLAKLLPRMDGELLAEAPRPRLPWTRFLPPTALDEFARELAETLEACASIGSMNRIAEVVTAWKATAAIYADLGLDSERQRPLAGTDMRVARPTSGAEEVGTALRMLSGSSTSRAPRPAIRENQTRTGARLRTGLDHDATPRTRSPRRTCPRR